MVVFKEVLNFRKYRVGNDGNVWSSWSGRWNKLKPIKISRGVGYLVVNLHGEKWNKNCYIHRLVLEAFVGPCPKGMECRHLDGNPENNRLSNLCWGTRLENCSDIIRHGKSTIGEKNARAVLSREKVVEIRRLYSQGALQRQLAEQFGVTMSNIGLICRGVNWSHLNKETGVSSKRQASLKGEDNPRSKLTAEQVLEIRRRRESGESVKSLAEEFGVRGNTISWIAMRKLWKHL